MKKTKRMIAMVLSLCLVVSAFSVSAAAAENDIDPTGGLYILSDEEIAALPSTLALGTPLPVTVPRTNGDGTNGNAILPAFKAEASTYEFRITSLPGGTTYNVTLHGYDPVTGLTNITGTPQIRKYINESSYFGGLQVGQYYYFMVSSCDLATSYSNGQYQFGPLR